MPIAARSAAVVAGILGGSGSHVVQIIIGIVVGVALIGYFLFSLGGRGGGGHVRAASVSQHDRETDRAREGAVSDATVGLVRTWSGIGIGAQNKEWNIAIDGIVVGSIANKETVEVAVEPGHHTLGLELRQTPQRGAVVRCRGGRGRRLSVPWTEDMADVGSGSRQARPMDLTQTGVTHVGKLGDRTQHEPLAGSGRSQDRARPAWSGARG